MSGETLGRYFNFEKNGYDSVMALYFKPGIGEWLWENGISLEQYLENLAWEENIDTSQLSEENMCVFNKMKELTLFKETIGKFESDSAYNLIFKYGDCSTSNVACTDGSEVDVNGNVTIMLEDIRYDPQLELAATFLHEGIHAELFRYVSRYENGIDPNNRERLFQLYYDLKLGIPLDNPRELSKAESDAQHHYMAENYVLPIARAIRTLDNNNYPLEYYMWYGWDGLEDYGYVNRLTNDEISELLIKQGIVNRDTNLNCYRYE